LFPHVCSYAGPEGDIRFRYLSKLAGNSPEKAIFKAKREQDNRFIVVKFTPRYNADAHRALADRGLAPRLFHIGDIYQSISSSRGLSGAPYMVVMEHVPGSPAHELFWKGPLPSSVFTDVLAAVNALHEKDIIFGDLRRTNIMVHKKRAQIVDFDWCGRDGVDRYPHTLNDSDEITWHPDVKRGSVMRKEHDRFMLGAFRPSLTDIGEDGEFQLVD
jgi:RIO-like serine/threonine protein kinase